VAAPGGRLPELLVEHGVPDRAVRLYLGACRDGPQTASELARLSGMHRVEAYRYIKQLVEQGLLKASRRRPMRFAALPPEELLDRWIRSATERLRRLEGDRERALAEVGSDLLEANPDDPKKFSVLEGQEEIYRFLARRIGTAKSEIRAAIPGPALAIGITWGIDRAFREAARRGVKIYVVTDIHLANRAEAKHFSTFVALRHSPRPLLSRSMAIDRMGAVAYVTGPEGIGGSTPFQVAIWSSSPSFRGLTEEYLRRSWSHAIPAERRIVELETPGRATLPMRIDQSEPFDRLREIAALGMRTMGIDELRLDLPEAIEAIGRQVGRQVSEGLDGETPAEVTRSLVSYYRRHALGTLEVAREKPLTLRVTQCFACVRQSPEIGRSLCPSILKSILEHRLGAEYDVSQPDPKQHATRGCLFNVTAS
jgi:sugar-specific transcriptional regulator TrmB/predicted hydrocarbon binding protein